MTTSALASLTATYTDSEGEEEGNEADPNEGTVIVRSPNDSYSDNKSNSSSQPTSPIAVNVTRKLAKLVSYIDDNVASDNEGEADEEISQHLSTNTKTDKKGEQEVDDEYSMMIPQEPSGHCSIELQERITKSFEKMHNHQLDMNDDIQKRKEFRNPSIYEKLIQFCGLNELGTNYPPSIYDPLKWSKESYYEELAKVQKVEMDKREKERKGKVDFLSSMKKHDDDKKRKSKWDQPGGGVSTSAIKPAGLVQPSLTNSATGTKGTVISAFGSLPKKPRQ